MIKKAINNNNFNQFLPPTSLPASRPRDNEIDNMLIDSQKVNYNPTILNCQEKKLKIIKIK